MGGVSRSWLRHDPTGHAVFEGEVSLARGGGFASMRSPVRALGLAGVPAAERLADAHAVGELDEAFHATLVSATGNAEIARVHQDVTERIRTRRGCC